MGAARHFMRWRWLLVLAFGASPVDWNNPEASSGISLRMSPRGYSNTARRKFMVSWNSLEKYVEALEKGSTTPAPEWEALGLFDADGQQHQMNGNELQIPAEYYSPIRIKPKAGDFIKQLKKEEVSHIEVRAIDVSPTHPNGINPFALAFSELLILSGLGEKQELLTSECRAMANQLQNAAATGKLHLIEEQKYKGIEFLNSLKPLAESLGGIYEEALLLVIERISGEALLPAHSLKVGFADALLRSQKNTELLRKVKVPEMQMKAFAEKAKKSLEEKQKLG